MGRPGRGGHRPSCATQLQSWWTDGPPGTQQTVSTCSWVDLATFPARYFSSSSRTAGLRELRGAPRAPVGVGGYRAGPSSGAPSLVPRGLGGLERRFVMRGAGGGSAEESMVTVGAPKWDLGGHCRAPSSWRGQGCALGRLWVLGCLADFLPQASCELAEQGNCRYHPTLWACLLAAGTHICLWSRTSRISKPQCSGTHTKARSPPRKDIS